MRHVVKIALVVGIGLIPAPKSFAESVYETQAQFLARAFTGSQPEPALIWLSGES